PAVVVAARRAQSGQQHPAVLGALRGQLRAERPLNRHVAVEHLVDLFEDEVGRHLIRSISRGGSRTISSLNVPSARTPAIPPFLTSARAPVMSCTTWLKSGSWPTTSTRPPSSTDSSSS